MFSAMSRALASLALALFMAQSTLCLAGVLRHPCDDCPGEASCGHEDDCSDDPCADLAIRPASSTQDPELRSALAAPLAVAPLFCQAVELHFPALCAPPTGINLPRHRSDTPLLI
jgi:hypothetical protein